MTPPPTQLLDLATFDAYLFDLDGVITPTVDVHRRAWQETFDGVFLAFGAAPYADSDYFDSLDGRPRFEGVAVLLAARGIVLPEGAADADDLTSVRGSGNRKNRVFTEVLERDGIEAYPGTLHLLERLGELGAAVAVVSSSRNAEPVLRAAGLRERFPVVVDGVVAEREGLPGKPEPDTYLRAALLLRADPSRCVVLEDAASGVAAGKNGDFGCVVGVDRGAGATALREAGARLVVRDLAELVA